MDPSACVWVRVFCGLHDAHLRIICPVCDISHSRKCTRASPTASDGKLDEGLGTREISSICGISWDTLEEPMSPGIPKDAWDNPRCPYQGGVHVSWILCSYSQIFGTSICLYISSVYKHLSQQISQVFTVYEHIHT